MPKFYRYADLVIASSISLDALTLVRRLDKLLPDLSFCLLDEPLSEPVKVDWLRYSHSDTRDLVLFRARKGQEFLLRFPILADFVISGDGRQVAAWPEAETNEETLRHLLLDQVLPRLLAQQGRLVLHASAVRVDDRAIAFVGESGRGKSTLAASLHMTDLPLLTDDGIVVTPTATCAVALPTYPSLRLWPDAIDWIFAGTPALTPMAHYSTKRRVVVCEAAEVVKQPLPLAALYVLTPAAEGDAVALTRLSPRDACMAIIGNAFQLDVSDHRRAAGLLDAAAAIAHQLPAFTLSLPRDFSSLPAVRSAILAQHQETATPSQSVPARE